MKKEAQDAMLSPTGSVVTRIKAQMPHDALETLPVFYRNLEEALDLRRASHNFHSIVRNNWQTSEAIDFCSGDILSLSASQARQTEFLAELSRNPDFTTGSSGVRLMDGNYTYLEQAEADIATFHGADAGLLVSSAYEANIAVWTAIPRPGDVIIYDELVHASTHEGMKQSLAKDRMEFVHSNVDAFRHTLQNVFYSYPLIKQRKRTVIVALESIYSMDGDVCPLRELLDVAKQFSQDADNIQFVVDEAHSVGVIGPKGAGLVCDLGLEKEIAVVIHSFGKAMGATGAVILGKTTIRNTIANFGRSFIYTTSPSFPFVAAIKSGYTLLKNNVTVDAQEHIQVLARRFFRHLTHHSGWTEARERGILTIPLSEDWEDRDFHTHIIVVTTQQKYTWWLYFHLLASYFCVFPVDFPVVPRGKSRLRIILHAFNTVEHVDSLIAAIFTWVDEILQIEDKGAADQVSEAARSVYTWMRQEGLTGYGML